MSDEEDVNLSEEETEDEEEAEEKMAPPADEGPTEAELAMQRRREPQVSSEGLDDAGRELLEANEMKRQVMSEEIEELRKRSELRKRERAEEEQEMAARRAEEDSQRKAAEEERKRKKEQDELDRKAKNAEQMAEFAKLTGVVKPNFVIIKKSSELVGKGEGEEDGEEVKEKYMSREQLEQERKAILGQRIVALSIDGFDQAKLTEKAKSLFKDILRLEGEKYDLEKRFKEQQYDMSEMSERARQINQVGKTGLKRLAPDETDVIAQKYSGAPGKIEMYSKFERQQDKRSYVEKHVVFTGPSFKYPADRIAPAKSIIWDEDSGIPEYRGLDGGAAPPPPAHEEPAPPPAEEVAAE